MNFILNLHESEEYISRHIRANNSWEPLTTEVILELLKKNIPDTVFVDIGANIGYFSMLAASKNVPVIAFEPVEANYSLLKKSITENNFEHLIVSYKMPLSDKKEEVIINVSENNMGLCSTRKLLDYDFSYSEKHMSENLDNFFGINTSNNLIVKIDVEETEKKVLYGMENTMRSGKVSHIIIEISGYDIDIFNFFRKHGFNVCRNIGFTDKIIIDENTNYLQSEKYISTLDAMELSFQQNPNNQSMMLFSKVK
jgi:FkbM family methyltransferase